MLLFILLRVDTQRRGNKLLKQQKRGSQRQNHVVCGSRSNWTECLHNVRNKKHKTCSCCHNVVDLSTQNAGPPLSGPCGQNKQRYFVCTVLLFVWETVCLGYFFSQTIHITHTRLKNKLTLLAAIQLNSQRMETLTIYKKSEFISLPCDICCELQWKYAGFFCLEMTDSPPHISSSPRLQKRVQKNPLASLLLCVTDK